MAGPRDRAYRSGQHGRPHVLLKYGQFAKRRGFENDMSVSMMLGRPGARRSGLAAAAVAAVAVVATACSSSSGNGNSGSSGSPAENGSASANSGSDVASGTPIKIGEIVSLTGSVGPNVTPYYHVTQMIVSDINAAGGINGHPIQMTYMNDQSDPAAGLAAAKKLVLQDGIKLLIGPFYTPPAVSVAAFAEQEKVLMYSPGTTDQSLTTPVQKYIFAAFPTATAGVNSIVQLMKSMRATKPGVIVENDSYGDTWKDPIDQTFQSNGTPVVKSIDIAADATDASTQVAQLKAAGVDVIIAAVADVPTLPIIKAINQQNLNVPLVTTTSASSIDSLLGSSAPITAYELDPIACPADEGSCVKSVDAEYHKKFPTDTLNDPHIGLGYATIEAFFAALKTAKDYTPDDVAAAMESAPAYQTPIMSNPIKWSATNHVGENAFSFAGWSGGKQTFFGTKVPASK